MSMEQKEAIEILVGQISDIYSKLATIFGVLEQNVRIQSDLAKMDELLQGQIDALAKLRELDKVSIKLKDEHERN